MRRIVSIFLYVALSVLIACSDQKNTVSDQGEYEPSRNTLRINLEDNIRSLNPLSITNDSEKTIGSLIYQGLFEVNKYGKVVPVLISEYTVDSVNFIYTYRLKPNIVFENGDTLNTDHIFSCLKNLIDAKILNSTIESFRNDIVGYHQYQSKILSNDENDSLPRGLQVIDEYSFSIQFIKIKPNLNFTLAQHIFWIHTTNDNGKYIGTGPYTVKFENEDISYHIVKRRNYSGKKTNLKAIDFRFIKDKEAELNEFLNGSLDLFIYKVNTAVPIDINPALRSIYGNYKKYATSSALIRHLSLHNFNSDLKTLAIHMLGFDEIMKVVNGSISNKEELYEVLSPSDDTTLVYARQLNLQDTLARVNIPLLVNCKLGCTQEIKQIKTALSTFFDVEVVNLDQLNPNQPYLVLEESELSVYSEKPNDETLSKSLKSIKKYKSSNQTVLIWNYETEYVISSIRLKGWELHTDWRKAFTDLRFIKPNSF